MKTWLKGLICIALSFMCLFVCVGYAFVSYHMNITGVAQAEPQRALFISDVSGGNYINPDTLAYSGTVVTSDLTLHNGEATYTITVFNNTSETYYYLAMVRGSYGSGDGNQTVAYTNDNITMSVQGIARGDSLGAGEKKTFTVKAAFKSGANTSDPTLFSIIEYRFSTTKPESSDEAAISGTLSRFPEVLRSSDSYNYLKEAMSDRNGRQNASYIGNVVGADSADSEAIKQLFGESLVLNIDGVDKPVTIMIKAENIDGNSKTGDAYEGLWGINQSGGEMTLYITADPLSSRGSATVYALVYTMDQTTKEWYQLGDVYMGTATIKGYDSLFNTGTGSFNTGDWKSVSRTYKVTDRYSYSVGQSEISNIVSATDANANAELRRLLQEAKDIVSSGAYFSEEVERLSDALTKYSKYYTTNATGTVGISGSPTRAEIVPIIRDLDNILKDFV